MKCLFQITQITWTDYLCDFLETTCPAELSTHISTVKRGHYALLEINVKLSIFRELVDQALDTATVKGKLDEYVEERQALAAARRDEALDEGRKRREEKQRRKSEAAGKEVIPQKSNGEVLTQSNHSSGNRLESFRRNSKGNIFFFQVKSIGCPFIFSLSLFLSLCKYLTAGLNMEIPRRMLKKGRLRPTPL